MTFRILPTIEAPFAANFADNRPAMRVRVAGMPVAITDVVRANATAARFSLSRMRRKVRECE